MPDLPLTSVALATSGTLTIQRDDGAEVPESISAGYNYSVDVATQCVQIVVQNTSSWPQVIERIKSCGTPVAADETQSITAGGDWCAADTRLAQIALGYGAQPRKIRLPSECPY